MASQMSVLARPPAKIQGPLKKVIRGWLEVLPKKENAISSDYYGNAAGGRETLSR